MQTQNLITLQIIIPVFNEAEVLPTLFERLAQVFNPLALANYGIASVHPIFVDDGSRDITAKLIQEEIESGYSATLLRLSRNFGHQNAITAGMEHSNADVVAIMDADLQDPPEVILKMVGKWRQGYDVVYAQRQKRKESWFKVFCYWAFYRLLKVLSEIEIAVDSGDFCLLDRKVINALKALPEKLRFPRGLRSWVGFRQTGLPYERDRRQAGKSKYPFLKLYQLATDGVASSSVRPLKLIQVATFLFALLLVGLLGMGALRFFLYGSSTVAFYSLIGYTLTASVGFSVLFSLYIICGYLGRMYLEIKQRPTYIVMEKIGCPEEIRLDRHILPSKEQYAA